MNAAKLSRPSLTVLDLNPAEVGRQAVELLVDIIEDREPAAPKIFVPTALLLRGSTRRPSTRGRAGTPRRGGRVRDVGPAA